MHTHKPNQHVPRCSRVLLLLLLTHTASAISVHAGGPGGALFIGKSQGAYFADFPMPQFTVTVELWSKLMPVSCTLARVLEFHSIAIRFCDF